MVETFYAVGGELIVKPLRAADRVHGTYICQRYLFNIDLPVIRH